MPPLFFNQHHQVCHFCLVRDFHSCQLINNSGKKYEPPSINPVFSWDAHNDTPLSTYLVHYDLALGGLGHVDHLLHHVVGVLVLHHGV